jgi:sulfite reductase (NADPH) flavoprotein alpha-component
MSAVVPIPQLPATLDPERREAFERLVDGLDAAQLQWLSGYLAGRAVSRIAPPQAANSAGSAVAFAPSTSGRATVLYGSQTGNGRRVAESLARAAESEGLSVRLVAAERYDARELAQERLLLVAISTQGDGDPPDAARAFVDFLTSRRAPALKELSYGVFALGDSSYPKFCETGRIVDERLAALGATRLHPRVDADLDYEIPAAAWRERSLVALRERAVSASVTALRPQASDVPGAPARHDRSRPFAAEVLANQRITAREGWRDVRHVELSLAGSGIDYQPGDALAVQPQNPPSLVAEWLQVLGFDGEAPVTHDGRSLPLARWLGEARELTRLARPFIARHAALGRHAELNRLLSPEHGVALGTLLRERQPIDLLRAHPAPWSPEELVASLRPLAPRLYSIASSMRAVGEEAHLTVARLESEHDGHRRAGAASEFLATRSGDGDTVPVYLEPNERFHLPTDGSRDLIMVGAGTGIAPYRAFVQDRVATGASGRHWLFFGAPRLRHDFLYQAEWLEALRRGQLQRLTPAFSRDGADKVHVQQRLREHGRELYDWIEQGAALYVCGDASRMAPDVNQALVDIVAEHGGVAAELAAERVQGWLADGRYRRDVY